jgi:hypothetical protein
LRLPDVIADAHAENNNDATEPSDRLNCKTILEGKPRKGEGGGLQTRGQKTRSRPQSRMENSPTLAPYYGACQELFWGVSLAHDMSG